MTRSELIRRIAERNRHLSGKEAKGFVTTLLSTIGDALCSNRRVELRGFGVFGVKLRKPCVRYNPRTRVPVSIPARRILWFRPGKDVCLRLNATKRKESAGSAPTSNSHV